MFPKMAAECQVSATGQQAWGLRMLRRDSQPKKFMRDASYSFNYLIQSIFPFLDRGHGAVGRRVCREATLLFASRKLSGTQQGEPC